MPTRRQFDHEKLQVYQIELQFIEWLTPLFEELQQSKRPKLAEAIDQLDRASLSSLLNTAEGNGRRASRQRVKFFDDACLDALVAKGACTEQRVGDGKDMLIGVVGILTKLIETFEKPAESEAPVRVATRTSVRRIG